MSSKIPLIVAGSVALSLAILTFLLTTSDSISFRVDSPGIYKLNIPRFGKLSWNFSNVKITENNKEIPFWIENFDKKHAEIWINVKESGRIALKKANRMYRGNGFEVFPVFDDFSHNLKFWRVYNELPHLRKIENMPKTKKCADVFINDKKLVVRNGKPFKKCRIEFKKDLLKITKIRLRVSGIFEIMFSDEKSRGLALESSFGEKTWVLIFKVRGKTMKKINLKPTDKWFDITISNGKVFVGSQKIMTGNFTPKRISLSVGFVGKIEIEYLYSLNKYKEVRFEK